jgi:hypothetical protein
MSENGDRLASGDDFRKAAEAQAWEEPRVITLPVSKARVKVRRPTGFYWKLRRTTWPRDLVEKVDAQVVNVQPVFTEDETRLLLAEQLHMVHEALIEPKVCLQPGERQFDTDWLDRRDGQFLTAYLQGYVNEDGTACKKCAEEAALLPVRGPWKN